MSPAEEATPPFAPPLTESQSTPVPLTTTPLRAATSIRQQTTGTAYMGTGFSPRTTLTPSYTGNMFSRGNGNGGRIANTFGSSPQCPRCSKAVYFAEQVRYSGVNIEALAHKT